VPLTHDGHGIASAVSYEEVEPVALTDQAWSPKAPRSPGIHAGEDVPWSLRASPRQRYRRRTLLRRMRMARGKWRVGIWQPSCVGEDPTSCCDVKEP
jgi:hypothetical protein